MPGSNPSQQVSSRPRTPHSPTDLSSRPKPRSGAVERPAVAVLLATLCLALSLATPFAQAQHLASAQPTSHPNPKLITVPIAPDASAKERDFQDKRFGVTFHVPPGWELSRKDGQVSTFHQDARTASPNAELRGVAILDFNPFPQSTLSGALFYYSVEPKTTDVECAAQATHLDLADTEHHKDVQTIGSVPFAHAHDEHGEICTEARDEVYTAFHKHACYRFDLAMNTFCSISSGAQEISEHQIHLIDERLAAILSTVTLKWEKAGANPVPVPDPPPPTPATAPAKTTLPGVL